MTGGGFPAVQEPFVHAPKVSGAEWDLQFIHQAGHEGQLLRGTDRTADAHGVIRGGLAPGGDIFQRLGEVKILQRVVKYHLETGPRKFLHPGRGQRDGRLDEVVFQRGVIPPIGGDGTDFAGHGFPSSCFSYFRLTR